MTRYRNGQVPMSALVQIDGEPYHYTSPKGLAMWHALQRNVLAKYKVKLRITPGWNADRPLANQTFARNQACAAGNCNSAAVPGFSSHGGTWKDAVYTHGVEVDAMAFDVDNWAEIGEAAFFEEARAVGFLVDGIRVAVAGHREPWHIIVLDPWGAIPASLQSEPVPPAVLTRKKAEMYFVKQRNGAKNHDGKPVNLYAIVGPGFYQQFWGDQAAAGIEGQLGKAAWVGATFLDEAAKAALGDKGAVVRVQIVNADEISPNINVTAS